MRCIHCHGVMNLGTTPFHIDRQGCHLVLDAVSAWVCEQCGETYFEEREVDAIQELVRSVEEKSRNLIRTD